MRKILNILILFFSITFSFAKGSNVTAQQVFANIEWATKNGVILEKIENVKYIDQAGKEQSGILELVKQEDGKLGIKTYPLSVIRQLISKPTYLPNRIIWSEAGKTTTVVGKWQGELEVLYNELTSVNNIPHQSATDLNIYMQSGKFDNPGGFNMLSIEGWTTTVIEEAAKRGIMRDTKAFDDFIWDTYNRPWIESAMQRGDNIIIWSNPTNLKKTKYIDGVIGPSFYERELEFLKNNSTKYNYDYNKGINSGKFSK